MTTERLDAQAEVGVTLTRRGDAADTLHIVGRYEVECRDKDGKLKWADVIENTVVDVGKNLLLDTTLAGIAYTTTGPFMGLISSVGYSAIAAGDNMTSHAGWTEAGTTNAPTYTVPRKTATWASASGGSKALAAALSFAITGTGTIKGAFMVTGAGAVNTVMSTAGVLFSAGVFTGGDRPVVNLDTVNVTYSVAV
jgi:hypothetical protein